MEVKALLKSVTACEDVTVGNNTDLSASGGSLQPARPRCRSILALPRKRCSAAGAAWDFLRWGVESRRSGIYVQGADTPKPLPSEPAWCPLRASEDIPRSFKMGEAGAAATR